MSLDSVFLLVEIVPEVVTYSTTRNNVWLVYTKQTEDPPRPPVVSDESDEELVRRL